jgi:exportin-2 (importin alpha re-exporter)
VTQLFGQYVSLMLQTYASNPNLNWKEKDCAIYLVVALTVRQKTAAQGATATNQLVNIGDFFTTQIEPELKMTDGSPVLRADALKFVTTFRSQVSSLAGSQMAGRETYSIVV